MTNPSTHSQATMCYKACIVMTYLAQLWICKNNLIHLSITSGLFILSPAMTFLPRSNFMAVSGGIYAAAEVLYALNHLTERGVVMFLCIRAISYMIIYLNSALSVMIHEWGSSDVMIHLIPLLWPKDKRKLQIHLLGFVSCVLIECGLDIAVPLLLAEITDMSGQSDMKRHILLYIGVTYLSSGPMSILKRIFLRPLFDDIDATMKTEFFSHVLGLSRDFHDGTNAANLGSLILTSPAGAELARLVMIDLIPLVMDFSIPLCILYHHFGPYVVMASAVTIVLDLWLSSKLLSQQTTCFKEFNRADKYQRSVFCKAIENWLAANYFGQTDREKSCYAEAYRKMAESGRRYSYWLYIRSVLSSTILYAGCAWMTVSVPEGVGSTGDFMLLVTCWNRLNPPLRELGRFGGKITEQVSKSEDIVAVLKRDPLVQDTPDARPLSSESPADVDLVDISFAYPQMTTNTLRGISVSFRRGQTTAIVGRSGGGKSTILKLILRTYDPCAGSVQIDGQDIRHITLTSLWRQIGIIPQDITFPDESVLSILQYANPNAPLDEIEEACEVVGLLGWIKTLPAEFETTVGERGVKISGGQRQRLSIAQNILKKPKILLLDEATSAIDAETKRLVHRYLKESTQTKIIVTHDLDAVRDFDKVIVIEDGMVVDQGNHEELMARPGYYRDVLHRQHHPDDQ